MYMSILADLGISCCGAIVVNIIMCLCILTFFDMFSHHSVYTTFYACTCADPQELKKHNAKVVVRCCDPSYSTESLTDEGIDVVVSRVVYLNTGLTVYTRNISQFPMGSKNRVVHNIPVFLTHTHT